MNWHKIKFDLPQIKRFCSLPLFCAILLLGAPACPAQTDPVTSSESSATFDTETATRAYLDRLTPEQKQRSDAYFEGGYWLQLWGLLYGLGVAALLLGTKLSARMRDLAGRVTRFKALQIAGYWLQYVVVTALLVFPLTIYEGFFREHQYGMSNQTFGGWLGDLLKSQGVAVVLGSMALIPIFALVRRKRESWHLYAAMVMVGFLALVIVISPVFLAPIFNQYVPLTDQNVRDRILSLARANGVPATEVFEMDASRQTKRISANVSGAFGTTRITLNDNLLDRCSLSEVEAVMGHELGHYVLNHVYKMLLFLAVLVVVVMHLLKWTLERLLARFGAKWGVSGPGDIAVLPLALAVLSVILFLCTPLTNTLIRTQEMEADVFGLNAARQPDGFAAVALKLSEYRKMAPGPIEEFLFFDHPSGATRIRTAMRWKAENLESANGTPLP